MKNKKGFVFVETIVVCAVLSVSLVTIYASFAMLLKSQKTRNNYNQAIYNYRTYSLAKEFTDMKCDSNQNYGDSISISKALDVQYIYYIKASNLNTLDNANMELQEYLKTIDTSETDTCLLIAQFKNKDKEAKPYFSYVTIGESL